MSPALTQCLLTSFSGMSQADSFSQLSAVSFITASLCDVLHAAIPSTRTLTIKLQRGKLGLREVTLLPLFTQKGSGRAGI